MTVGVDTVLLNNVRDARIEDISSPGFMAFRTITLYKIISIKVRMRFMQDEKQKRFNAHLLR